MIATLIRWSSVKRSLVLLATIMVAAWSVYSSIRTPLDALPAEPKAATAPAPTGSKS